MPAINLGMPKVPELLAPRRKSRQIAVGKVLVGGDTIRVSLSAPPVEEVKVGLQILQSLGLRERKLEIVSCPSCGRAQVDVYTLADEVTAELEGMTVPLRVAVMGCVVNGPGEAREADLGVASGNLPTCRTRRLANRSSSLTAPRRTDGGASGGTTAMSVAAGAC